MTVMQIQPENPVRRSEIRAEIRGRCLSVVDGDLAAVQLNLPWQDARPRGRASFAMPRLMPS